MTRSQYPEIRGGAFAIAAQLWAEWRDALCTFWDERIAGRLGENREFVRLDMGGDEIALHLVDGHGVRELARTSCQDALAMANLALAMPEARSPLKGAGDVVLQFEKHCTFRLQLELPAASKPLLRKAIAFELERLSPIEPDKLYFDFSTAKCSSKKRARIELRAVKRAVVDQAITLCHASNLRVAAILFEGDVREAGWRSFPVDWPAFFRWQWMRKGASVLGTGALVLFAGVLFAVYLRGAEQSDFMLARLSAVNEQVGAVHHLQQEIHDLQSKIAFPITQKRAPLLIDVLSQMSAGLPDGAWLTEFHVKDGKVTIRGFSKSPSDLINVIDQSPHFANAEFSAPLEGAQDGTERFDLSFDVKRTAKP